MAQRAPLSLPAPSADALIERLVGATIGAMDLFSVYLGDRLELYTTLASGDALTAADLATRTGTDPRYIREWLEHQAVGGFLVAADQQQEPENRRYSLPAGHATVLTDHDHVLFGAPLASQIVGIPLALHQMLDAYRTGNGVPFEVFGEDMRRGIAEANRVLFINQLGTAWFPHMPDVVERLCADPPARIADVACGSGWSSIAIARAYPGVRVDGFDLDEASIADAVRNAEAAGVGDRVRFQVRDAADPRLHGVYDLACAFECIHDMAKPVDALRAMRALVGDGGTVLIGDERVADTFQAPGNDLERLMYGFSILHCLAVGRADQPSAGTGTVMRPDTMRRYATGAGFRDASILPIEHDIWRFYRLYP